MSIATLIHAASPAPPPIDPADPVASHPAAILARRIDSILLPFLALIGFLQHLLGPLALPVHTRLARTRQRLLRALARIAAGRTPRRRTPVAGPADQSDSARTPAHPRPRTTTPSLRRRHGWLAAALDHNARGLASQLSHLLAEPGVADLLASSPGAARTLRPLCRMLGATLPAPLALPPPPPRPRRPRPPRPAPEPRRPGKYARINPLTYSPGRIPPWHRFSKPA